MNSAQVNALAFGTDGSIYAGGLFTTAGGVSADYIARWDGAEWHPFGQRDGRHGPTPWRLALMARSTPVADFTTAGGVAANYIARWDGSLWHPLGSGMGGDCQHVYALAVGPDGSLYAGGWFTACWRGRSQLHRPLGRSDFVVAPSGQRDERWRFPHVCLAFVTRLLAMPPAVGCARAGQRTGCAR